jgi:Mrp family chromosome partitioning ATPase
VLLARHALGHDGGTTRFLALARALSRRGCPPRILAGPGPLEAVAARSGELELVDWAARPPSEARRLLARAAAGRTAVLIGCLPSNLPHVPALARRCLVHVCVHSTPAALATAFGGWEALPVLGSALRSLEGPAACC